MHEARRVRLCVCLLSWKDHAAAGSSESSVLTIKVTVALGPLSRATVVCFVRTVSRVQVAPWAPLLVFYAEQGTRPSSEGTPWCGGRATPSAGAWAPFPAPGETPWCVLVTLLPGSRVGGSRLRFEAVRCGRCGHAGTAAWSPLSCHALDLKTVTSTSCSVEPGAGVGSHGVGMRAKVRGRADEPK